MTVNHHGLETSGNLFSIDNRKRTIGLISTTLWAPQLGLSLLNGVAEVAQEKNVNFICFQGQNADSPEKVPANRVYEMINAAKVDGLVIWASSFVNDLGKEGTLTFFQRFQPLPMVSIGMPLPGVPCILVDSYRASREIIEHLIVGHHCRRIAFMRGPQGHYDSDERFRAYLDALDQYQLPLDPDLISAHGSWEPDRVTRDIRVWLDAKQVCLDALVAPSDRLAVAAIRELQQRGIEVPKTVAVVGVNDEPYGKAIHPPLTTTTTMIYERGRLATKTLLELIQGKPAPPRIYLPYQLIIRRSCGCPSPNSLATSIAPADGTVRKTAWTAAMKARRQNLIGELLREFPHPDQPTVHQLESLFNCLIQDLNLPSSNSFTRKLEQILIRNDEAGKDIRDWELIITRLRKLMTPLLDAPRHLKAENLWFQSKAIISEFIARWVLKQQQETIDQIWIIQRYTQLMVSTFDLPELIEVIRDCLLNMGFSTFYLSLYEKWAHSHPDPNLASLILAHTPQGKLDLSGRETCFTLPDLIPPEFLATGRTYSLIVLPLFFETHQLGILLLDRVPFFMMGIAYTSLQAQISSALWGSMLFNKQKQTENNLVQQTRDLTRSNSEWQKFAFMSSHDLQEPLRKISVFCGRLHNNFPSFTAQQFDYLERVQAAALRMQSLINDLLDFSQIAIKNQPFETIELSRLAAEVISDLEVKITHSQARIELGPLPAVWAAPLQMRLLFQNLISNGLKFGRENIPPCIRITSSTDSEGDLISFTDNGIGIDPRDYERIFHLFERLDHREDLESSGMGLAICKKVVEHHAGTIRVESVPGNGSTFIVKIPFKHPDSKPEALSPLLASKIRQFGEERPDLNPIQPAKSQNRPTIGLVSNQLWSWSLGLEMIDGAADSARKNGANFICFQGRPLDRHSKSLSEDPVFDLIGSNGVDGLVIWGSNFLGQLGADATMAFFDRLRPLPVVSIGMALPGIPGLMIDSYQGMRNILTHLIEEHRYRRIAFCRGPQEHLDSKERFRAYLDIHAEYHLPVNPALISPPGEWHLQRLLEDIDFFLAGNSRPEVMIAPNDLLAIEAIRELHRRKIRVPMDMAVIGLNDAPSGKITFPPLTTENIKLYERAYTGVEILLQFIAGQTVPPQITMPPELIIRRSCGCISPILKIADLNTPGALAIVSADSDASMFHSLQSNRSIIGAELLALFSPGNPNLIRNIELLPGTLISALERDDPQLYLTHLEQSLIETDRDNQDIQQWHQIISVLRCRITPLLNRSGRVKADHLWFQSLEIIAEFGERLNMLSRIETAERNWHIQYFAQQLNSAFEWQPLLQIMSDYLLSEGFGTFFLSIYENPSRNRQNARLLLAFRHNQPIPLPEEERLFTLPNLVPAGLLNTDDVYSLIMIPLQYETEPVGFILLERQPFFINGIIYSTLQNQLGSALWRTLLFQKQIQTEAVMVHHAQNLARSNTDLQQFAYIASHELQEPLYKIAVFAELFKKSSTKFTSRQLDYVERMLKATARMQNLISDLLTFSQISAAVQSPETVSLTRIAEAAFRNLETAINLAQARIEMDELPAIRVDPLQIQLLFQNLISNAIKFQRPGVAPWIQINVETTSDAVTLFFKDNGIGIHPDYHERIFTLFERLHDRSEYEGSGVGLPICRKIAERHGGTLTLKSTPGAGSTFIVRLPVQGKEEK